MDSDGNTFPLFEYDSSLAFTFNKVAEPLFADFGFKLSNDPKKVVGRFCFSCAEYQTDSGLFLSLGFEPNDGAYLLINAGRKWEEKSGPWYSYSNSLCALMECLDVEVPLSYPLRPTEDLNNHLNLALKNIIDCLPQISNSLRLETLYEIEGKEFGALVKAETAFGQGYMNHVDIIPCDI